MSLGGTNNAVAGINLTNAELAQVYTTASGTVTIGDSSQTGNITFTTATPATTPGGSTVVVQSPSGPGQIVLDDAGAGIGLNGNGGSVALTPGSGGIATPLSAAGVPLITQAFNATGLTLTPTLRFAPTLGAQLTLINNTAAPAARNPIIGSLANVPLGGTISATYGGTTCWFQANYAGGDGNDLVLTAINNSGTATTTTLSSSQASAMYGAQVTFTATVAAQSGSAAPAGSVEFFDGNTELGGGTPSASNGATETWTFTTPDTPQGRLQAGSGQIITAVYTPLAGFAASTGTTSQAIAPLPITVAAVSSTKTYDSTVSSTATPAISDGNLAPGDIAAFGESFDTRNAGTGKTLTPAGSVNDGNGGDNYAVTFINNTAGTITARPITVTAVVSTKFYDGTTSCTSMPAVTSGSLVDGDTPAFIETFDTAAIGTSKTLIAGGSANDGNGGNNYTATFVNNTAGAIVFFSCTTTLTWPGPGSPLSLAEGAYGATPTVVISEPSPGVSMLEIDLGSSCSFASDSTTAATGLSYQNPGSPTTSHYATIDISSTGNVASLLATLPGDGLTLGPILDLNGSVESITASAGTIEVAGISTANVNGDVDLRATGNLTVDAGDTIQAGAGTISLAADVNADGTGYGGVGILSIGAGALVASSNPTSNAITLRGADINIDTSANPAVVETSGSWSTTPSATFTGLDDPCGMVFDPSGDLYVSNYYEGTVSEVAAGSTTPTATLTGLDYPATLAFDPSGNLFVANSGNNTVSEFAPGATTSMATLSGLDGPNALAFDPIGNLYVANYVVPGTVSEFNPGATTPSATLTGLNDPVALAFDSSGNLYVADWNTVSKFDPGATTPGATFTGLSNASALAIDPSGNIYVTSDGNPITTVSKFAPGVNTPIATITGMEPGNLAVDRSGNLYVMTGYNTVSEYAADGISPSAGGVVIRSSLPSRPMSIGGTNTAVAGINLTDAELAQIQTSASGTVTFGDSSQTGNITLATATPATTPGASTVVVQAVGGPGQIILDDAAGTGTALNGNGGDISLTAGTGGIAAASANNSAAEIATTGATVTMNTAGPIGTAGNRIQFAENTNTADQVVEIGWTTEPSSVFLDGLGTLTLGSIQGSIVNTKIDVTARTNLVVAAGGTVNSGTSTLSRGTDLNPDGTGNDGVGTLSIGAGALVTSTNPTSSAVTLRGANVNIDTSANPAVVGAQRVLSTTPTAILTGPIVGPEALAFDASGNLYVINSGNGTVSEFASGATVPDATLTGLDSPNALAVDATGNLYVINGGNGTVSEFAPGAATPTATLTGLNVPGALAFGPGGNLYVLNRGNDTVSEFAPGATTPSTTLAGLSYPGAMAVDDGGNVYVANHDNMGIDTVTEFAPGATTPTATIGWLMDPGALTVDSSGNLFLIDYESTLKEFAALSNPTAGGVVIRSSLPSLPIIIGGTNNAGAGIHLTDAELAQIYTTASGTLTIGDNSQTGNITFTAATPATTPGASMLVLQSASGPGEIILDGAGTAAGLNGNGGTVTLKPGSGGIVAPLSAGAVPLASQGFNATGLRLTPTLSFAPVSGTQLTLINNTAAPAASYPITGAFANLPQGGHIAATYGGTIYWFQASYAGGDGNDLVLTAITPSTPTTTTTTILSTSKASVTYDTPVTFTATVTAQSGSAAPLGNVEFFDGSRDLGAGTLGSSMGTVSSWTLTTGTKTFNVTAGDMITAAFSSWAIFAGSSGTASETVAPLPITVAAASATKVYDGGTSSPVAPIISPGLVAGDSAAFIETYDTPDMGVGKTLAPAGSVDDGNGGNNYAVTFVERRQQLHGDVHHRHHRIGDRADHHGHRGHRHQELRWHDLLDGHADDHGRPRHRRHGRFHRDF
jgi:hypothetical protein